MAEVNGTPKLKRKRNGVEPQRKKIKTENEGLKKGGKQAEKVGKKDTDLKSSTPQKVSNATSPSPSSKAGVKSATTPSVEDKSASTPQRLKSNGTPVVSMPSQTRKDKKKDREQTKAQPQEHGQNEPAGTPDISAVAAMDAEDNQLAKKDKKQKKQKDKLADQWSLSGPHGGLFLPQDPVFSLDEKYLLLAKPKTLEIYATETSLLVQELPVGASAVIVSYCISSVHPNQVYMTDSAGIITLWNWTNGSKVGRWDIGATVRHLGVVKQPDAEQDLLFVHETIGKSHIINVHALRTGAQASKTELKRIMKTSTPITGIQVLLQGKIVVACSAKSVMIGKRMKLHKTAVQDFEYVWREFETSNRITAFSSYVRLPDTDKNKKAQTDPRDHLDLATGDSEGVIHLFENILSTFASIEKSQKTKAGKVLGPESLRPKRLHWHREAVGALKWSLDGNYLISGGNETVLTIWQLATGKQQHLPHLTAAIESVVVSPSGASYGISLANNSVIVLSTSELQPKTNIVGLQTRRLDHTDQLSSRVSDYHNQSFAMLRPVPMAVNSKNRQAIFATPSSQPRSQRAGFIPEPYAQTFDLATHRPISRQALTRNNATDPNIDPEGRRILEPNVQFVQISHDGAWLATVDEWLPPRSAMSFIEEGEPASNEEERFLRREVYLKIWRWDDKDAQWVLDARIDAPHFHKGVSAHARVFDLVADPSSTGFATIGEDLVVRVWRPKTRTRDGIVIRGGDKKQGLVTWSLNRSTEIPSRLDFIESEQRPQDMGTLQNCRLAFSDDGSVLAAGVSWASGADPGVVHMVDIDNGVVRRSNTEIDVTALSGLAIVGRYLVAVSTSVTVWDMILDQLVHIISIDASGIDDAFKAQLVRLAVCHEDGTFAVSASRFDTNETVSHNPRKPLNASTKVSIFNPSQAKAIWTRSIPGVVLALASAKGERSYVALDASSSIRTISSKANAQQLPTPPPDATSQLTIDGTIVEEDDEVEKKPVLELEAGEQLLQDSENDKPVVRPEQLQEIFESGASHVLPAVRDMFEAVVGLYARKPRAADVLGPV